MASSLAPGGAQSTPAGLGLQGGHARGPAARWKGLELTAPARKAPCPKQRCPAEGRGNCRGLRGPRLVEKEGSHFLRNALLQINQMRALFSTKTHGNRSLENPIHHGTRSPFPTKTSLTFPLADCPPGPVQALEAPTAPRAGRASCQRASPTLALCAFSLFLPDAWWPGTVPLDGTSVGQGIHTPGSSFPVHPSFHGRRVCGEAQTGRRHPGRQGHQIDSRGSEHGTWSRRPRSPAPTPAGPGPLSSHSGEAAAAHTSPSSGPESFPKKVLETLGKSQAEERS